MNFHQFPVLAFSKQPSIFTPKGSSEEQSQVLFEKSGMAKN
jgi:hypothetical protein